MYIYNLYRLLRVKLTEKMDYLEGLIEILHLLISAVKYNRQLPCSLRFCVIYNP